METTRRQAQQHQHSRWMLLLNLHNHHRATTMVPQRPHNHQPMVSCSMAAAAPSPTSGPRRSTIPGPVPPSPSRRALPPQKRGCSVRCAVPGFWCTTRATHRHTHTSTTSTAAAAGPPGAVRVPQRVASAHTPRLPLIGCRTQSFSHNCTSHKNVGNVRRAFSRKRDCIPLQSSRSAIEMRYNFFKQTTNCIGLRD